MSPETVLASHQQLASPLQPSHPVLRQAFEASLWRPGHHYSGVAMGWWLMETMLLDPALAGRTLVGAHAARKFVEQIP